MTSIALISASIFFVLGFIGTLLPILPGASFIWLGMLIYGFMTDFVTLDIKFYILQGIVVVFIFLIDYVAGSWGVGRYGGSKSAALGSIVGGIIGLATMGPVGIILGPFVGAALVEIFKGNSLSHSIQVGWGTIVGFLGGTVLKFILEIVMVMWFFLAI